MPRNTRIFPFFLDGGIQEVTEASDSWDGTSSFIEVTKSSGAVSLSIGITDSYGRPIPHGAMLVVKKTANNYNSVTINPSADFNANDDTIDLRGKDSMALFMFKGPSTTNDKGEWVEITRVTDVSNKSFSSVDVSFNLDVDGTTTLDEVSVDESATFNSFVIDNITIVDKDGDDQTLTVAQLEDGLIQHTPSGANESVILPTADLLAASLESVGDSIRVFVHNDDAINDSTVEMGSGGTLVAGSATISAGICAEFLIRMTNVTASSETYDVYRL